MALDSNSSTNRLATKGLMGETMGCSMDLFKIFNLDEEIGIFEEKFQQSDDVLGGCKSLF